MRNVLCFVLLASAVALAAGTTQPVTALAPENGTADVVPSPALEQVGEGQPNTPPRALVGSLDTIGGTTYDWWANGPVYRMIANSPTYGVHVTWMYSAATTGQDFPDRNMRYNFYDFATRVWNWVDVDHMQSGVSAFDKRAGYGSIDGDPASGIAVIGGHVTGTGGVVPRIARDAAPGAGIFEYADGEPALGVTQWPPISLCQDGTINTFPMTAAYDMSYSNIAPGNWPTFSTPVTGIQPSPGFPNHNIAASKVSNKVSLVWEVTANTPQDAYQMHSTDGGITWDTPTTLDPPAAFGGDTATSYYITSLFPWYDRQDKFHVVANFMPMVNDTGYIFPSQIWHYCPDNSTPWSRIHVASVDPANYQHPITSNATLACRPSIGQDDDGNLFVAWEQFDTLNYEPTTSRARADVFWARSTNNGQSWGGAERLTDAGSYSMRFPSVIDLAVEGDPDTMYVVYLIDSVAGFYVAAGTLPSEGPATPNPVVVQKVPLGPPWVADKASSVPAAPDVDAWPNPFGRSTRLTYSVPHSGNVSLDIFDAAGRNVRSLASGRVGPGRFDAVWDGRSQAGARVPEGVYLYRYALDGRCITGKLTLAR